MVSLVELDEAGLSFGFGCWQTFQSNLQTFLKSVQVKSNARSVLDLILKLFLLNLIKILIEIDSVSE